MPPTIVCVRGPSGSGKTSLLEALAPLLAARGMRVAAIKRSHHALDLAGKDSDRLVGSGMAAALVHGADGAAVFRTPDTTVGGLLSLLPADVDLVLVETYRPERFPVLLADGEEAEAGETLLGRFALPISDGTAAELAGRLESLVRARGRAAAPAPTRKPHRCAGAVLGQRLAAYGAALLGIEIPRTDHGLFVVCENDGCAAEALITATGCHPGSRSLRFSYEGKLAATFVDVEAGRAVRVFARGDLRDRAATLYPDTERHTAQMLTYEVLVDSELFGYRFVAPPAVPARRPGHAICARCEEEVDGDVAVVAVGVAYCRACHACVRAAHGSGRSAANEQEEAG